MTLTLFLEFDGGTVTVPRTHLNMKWSSGAEWRSGWPELTSGRGGLNLNKSFISGVSEADLFRPCRFTLRTDTHDVAQGLVEPLAPVTARDGRDVVQARLFSQNAERFGKEVEWSQQEDVGAYESIRGILTRQGIPHGSIAVGTSSLGIAGYQGSTRSLLSQIGRVLGAVVCESHKGDVSAVSFGHAVGLGRFPRVLSEVYDSASAGRREAYNVLSPNRLVLPSPDRITSVPVAFVQERVLPGESLILSIEADSRNLIDAGWGSIIWPPGITERRIFTGPYSLVLELTNTTEDVVPLDVEVEGRAVFSTVHTGEAARDSASIRLRGEQPLDARPWFAAGSDDYASFFVDDVAGNGLAVAIGSASVDLQHAPLNLRPADVVVKDEPDAGASEWIVYNVGWECRGDGLAIMSYEMVGTPSDHIEDRWGRARWDSGKWR